MRVSDAMTPVTAMVGPEHTLRQAAERMVSNGTGAAVVFDPSLPGPGVITERDLLRALGAGLDPGAETVGEHMSGTLLTAAPSWSMEQAASLMIRHNIRHVLVFDGDELAGVLSMRDVLRDGGIVMPESNAGAVSAAA